MPASEANGCSPTTSAPKPRASYLIAPDGTGSAIPVEIGLVGALPLEKLDLYAAAGGGYYVYDVDSSGPSWADTTPDPVIGFYGAAGIKIPIGQGVRLNVELKYTGAKYSISDTRTYQRGNVTARETYKAEGGFNGIGLNLGVQWSF